MSPSWCEQSTLGQIIFVHFLEESRIAKGPFEMKWPLESCKHISFTLIMAFLVVEFSRRDTKLESFLAKNQLYSNEITEF